MYRFSVDAPATPVPVLVTIHTPGEPGIGRTNPYMLSVGTGDYVLKGYAAWDDVPRSALGTESWFYLNSASSEHRLNKKQQPREPGE